VASVDTYLRFAEAAGRLNLEATRKPGLPELLQGVTGAVTGAVTGGGTPAPAEVTPAQDAAALPAGAGDGAGQHDDHDEHAPVALSARREKERGR
jgi:hypothetical protein